MVAARVWLPWSEDQILWALLPRLLLWPPLTGPRAAGQLRRCHNHVVLTTTLPQRRSCRRPASALPGRLPSEKLYSRRNYVAGQAPLADAMHSGQATRRPGAPLLPRLAAPATRSLPHGFRLVAAPPRSGTEPR